MRCNPGSTQLRGGSLCGADVALLGVELVGICIRGRQRLRSHGHRVAMLLKRVSFLDIALDGFFVSRLGMRSFFEFSVI